MAESEARHIDVMKFVLEKVPDKVTDEEVHFDRWLQKDGPEPPKMLESLFILKETWDQLGNPEKLFVTIERNRFSG